VVRRSSLVFSLALIVAVAVGFFARHSELAQQRDLDLQAAAELGATRLEGLIDAIEVAASIGGDPEQVARTLGLVYPGIGVCSVASSTACAGTGATPPADVIAEHQDGWAAGGAAHPTTVVAHDALLTIHAAGRKLSVIADVPVELIPARSHVLVRAATNLPEGAELDEFEVEGGLRQIALQVDAGSPVYVVATTRDSVSLPEGERNAYAVIFALAVLLLGLAGVTLVVEQRNLLERAAFDTLTKLPNRSEFERCAQLMLADAQRRESSVCVLLFDLNAFKHVNDTYGHAVGDELLKVVGSRLRKSVRDDDIVARWGGDEFVVMMPDIDSVDMASARVEQLIDQVAGRTRIDGVSEAMRIKVSVGVAVWPEHGVELPDLVESADHAMYQAKRDGDTWRVAGPGRVVENAGA
jgi:diguanylate cyclase (GGDEF)-like protein